MSKGDYWDMRRRADKLDALLDTLTARFATDKRKRAQVVQLLAELLRDDIAEMIEVAMEAKLCR